MFGTLHKWCRQMLLIDKVMQAIPGRVPGDFRGHNSFVCASKLEQKIRSRLADDYQVLIEW